MFFHLEYILLQLVYLEVLSAKINIQAILVNSLKKWI